MIPATGYLLALLIGLCLGLLGSGGSILTLPVLVYLFRLGPVTGTAYSLFIVGVTSLAGLLPRLSRGEVHLRAALAFAGPSLAGVYLVRAHVIHSLPETLRFPAGPDFSRDAFIMVLFACVMAAAGLAMLVRRASEARSVRSGVPSIAALLRIAAAGLLAGALSGFVGAGGGFLIIPALVLLAGMPMAAAVGTSLALIAAQSLVGFAADWRLMDRIDWAFLLGFTFLSISGAVAGSLLGRRLDGSRLRAVFGWLILCVAVAIFAKEIFT